MEELKPTIVILKTGEQLICDLKEIFDGEGVEKKGICLLMRHPHVLSLIQNTAETYQDVQIKFSKWCPYSTDIQFKIPYDIVVAIGACDAGLSEAYVNKISQIEQALNSRQQEIINPEVMPNE